MFELFTKSRVWPFNNAYEKTHVTEVDITMVADIYFFSYKPLIFSFTLSKIRGFVNWYNEPLRLTWKSKRRD